MESVKFIDKNIFEYTVKAKKNQCHFDKTLKTNVNGVFKQEWWYDPFEKNCPKCKRWGGASVMIAFERHEVAVMTPKGKRMTYVCFTTSQEAFEYYEKTKKKKGYTVQIPTVDISLCGDNSQEVYNKITEYIEKRGFNKQYDLKIVEVEEPVPAKTEKQKNEKCKNLAITRV
jgi:hypothetical protein